MTEQSGFWDSTGTGDGAVGGYTETQLYQHLEALFLRTKASECVLKNFLNALAVTGATSPVAINTGAAVVAGFWYINDASVNIAIPTPAVSTRIDRIILRVSWSAQTVRLVRLAGTEGGAAPTLTQTLNTTYEVSLAQVSITTGGAITLTDERQYAKFNTEVDTNTLADDAVTFAKMQNVTTDRLLGRDTASSGNVEEISAGPSLAFSGSQSLVRAALTGDVTASQDGNATTIANDVVTDGKLRDSAALSVIGRGSNSTGDPADIVAGTDGHVLRRSGTTLAFGTVVAAGLASDAVITAKILDLNVTGAKIANQTIDPSTKLQGTNGIIVDPANGNARGTDAVDLQTIRNMATNVASGETATIGGGHSNTASGLLTTVSGGTLNNASDNYASIGGGHGNVAPGVASHIGGGFVNQAIGDYSVVSGGQTNEVSGDMAAIGGGELNVASGGHTTVPGGELNNASGDHATVPGGESNTASGGWSLAAGTRAVADKYGQVSFSAGRFAADGDAQHSFLVMRNVTTNSTPTELFLDGSSLRLTIPTDTTWVSHILVVARRTDVDGESAGYSITGVIDNNAGTTAAVGGLATTTIAEDTAAWSCIATADNTNDALVITVTGENAKTIRWVASVRLAQVTG